MHRDNALRPPMGTAKYLSHAPEISPDKSWSRQLATGCHRSHLLVWWRSEGTVIALAWQMPGHVELAIVPGATHLFEEPGTLDRVEALAADWFKRYLRAAS